MTAVVGSVLVAGAVVFTVGAARSRLEYERPLAKSLPPILAHTYTALVGVVLLLT